jgi:hypothetical protein
LVIVIFVPFYIKEGLVGQLKEGLVGQLKEGLVGAIEGRTSGAIALYCDRNNMASWCREQI